MHLPATQLHRLSEANPHSILPSYGPWVHLPMNAPPWEALAQIIAANIFLLYCLVTSLQPQLLERRQQTERLQSTTATRTQSFKLNIPTGIGVTGHLVIKDKTVIKIGLSIGAFKLMLIKGKSWWEHIKVTATGLVKCSTGSKKKQRHHRTIEYRDASTQC